MVHRIKSNFVVIARNVVTGKTVELPLTAREEVNSMRWYPQTDYVPLKIKKR
jgi:hypothetical protein